LLEDAHDLRVGEGEVVVVGRGYAEFGELLGEIAGVLGIQEGGQGRIQAGALDNDAVIGCVIGAVVLIHEGIAEGVLEAISVEGGRILFDDRGGYGVFNALERINEVVNGVLGREASAGIVKACCNLVRIQDKLL